MRKEEEFSEHRLVHEYISGQMPLKKYVKLFNKRHESINLLEMAFSEKELKKLYNECPSLRPKEDRNQRRGSLELIIDNLEDKKNQVVGKVVDFVKRIGIRDII